MGPGYFYELIILLFLTTGALSIKWLDEKEAFKVGFHEPIKLGAVPAN